MKGMNFMHHDSMNQPQPSSINQHPEWEVEQQLEETLLHGIKGKASTVDLYNRLAGEAPNQKHQLKLLRMMEDEQRHWWQLTNLYMTVTGREPVYQVDRVPFHSYRDGLQKGYETELAGYEQFRIACLRAHHQSVYDVLMNTCMDEWEHAKRLGKLGADEVWRVTSQDYGPAPYVVNIDEATIKNDTFRTAIWTGKHLQVTLMSIAPGEDIGLEIHPHLDQFLRLEQGTGIVQMGDRQDQLTFQRKVAQDDAIMIPAGTWHNVINTGNTPIKLYSIYAPPQHPPGTVHQTKADAEAAEKGNRRTGY